MCLPPFTQPWQWLTLTSSSSNPIDMWTTINMHVVTLNSAYNEKKYVEILLHYRQLFIKGDVFIGEWGIFGAEVFLHYNRFFIKGNFIIGRVECI